MRTDHTDRLSPVVGKARSYLRTSTILLSAALALCAAVILVLQHQADLQRDNFDANSNVHVITVTHRVVGREATPLTSADVATLRATVAAAPDARGSRVSPKLTLGAGLTGPDGQPVSVIGIEPSVASLVGLPSMRDGVGYRVGRPGGAGGTAAPEEHAAIDLPVVTRATADGVVSDKLARLDLVISPTADRGKVTYLEGGRVDELTYVTAHTFWQAAEKMFSMKQPQIEAAYAAGELPMVPLVSAAYVDVPDLEAVRSVARSLEGKGYGLNYALQAFDEVEQSLVTQRLLGLALGVVVLLGVGAYFVLSWRSYVALCRRDIGILRHWQVPREDIEAVYARRLTRSIVVPLALALVLLWVGSVVLFGVGTGAARAAMASAGFVVAAAALWVVVRRLLIRPVVDLDVLVLLTAQRQFQ